MSYHTCRILTEYFSWQDSLRSLPVKKENLFAGTISSTGLQGHYSYQLTVQRRRSPRRVGPQAWSLVTLDKITLHPVYQITWPGLKLLWNRTAKLWCNLLSGVTGCHQTVSSAPLLRPHSLVLATLPCLLWPCQNQQYCTLRNLMVVYNSGSLSLFPPKN